VRLSLHIFFRGIGRGEDFRYAEMRRSWGSRFPWISLFSIFLLQAGILWAVAMPLWQAARSPAPARLGALDLAGAIVFAVGFLFEAVGDEQLRRFKADPASRGKVMDRGLWRYTRHPNYFGDALVWWGLFLVALATPGSAWTVYAPAAMTLLLMKVSGVALLEKTLASERPGYREYMERTSAFVPMPPRRPRA
jgi:steroid 5-alpha reductase family enzyme